MVRETIKQVTNPHEWYDPVVCRNVCIEGKKIRKDRCRNVNCYLRLIRMSSDFYFYFMTSVFKISTCYFSNQKTSISSSF